MSLELSEEVTVCRGARTGRKMCQYSTRAFTSSSCGATTLCSADQVLVLIYDDFRIQRQRLRELLRFLE